MFVLHADALHGVPYDGHTLGTVLSEIETAKLNGLDPERYLREVMTMIVDHPTNCIGELLPWNM